MNGINDLVFEGINILIDNIPKEDSEMITLLRLRAELSHKYAGILKYEKMGNRKDYDFCESRAGEVSVFEAKRANLIHDYYCKHKALRPYLRSKAVRNMRKYAGKSIHYNGHVEETRNKKGDYEIFPGIDKLLYENVERVRENCDKI